ncbi:hypothetical protein OQA88_584 [Cercophora sp. LCS_1]
MSLFTRTARPFSRLVDSQCASICAQCRRSFASSSVLQSGHNKWSKIKHDKAANDNKMMKTRSHFAKLLILYSKLYGPNPDHNPQLANTILQAKKAGVPKEKIEGAIARGQGKSSTGAILEPMTFEAMVPPSIALVIEVETDNRQRVLQELNLALKKGLANASSSKFFFTRQGRVVFEKTDGGPDVEALMDDAIEAGAEDIENDGDGNIVIWTQPNLTTHILQTLGTKFGLQALSSGIIWSPNKDTMAELDKIPSEYFVPMLRTIREFPDVQAMYSNVTKGALSDKDWASVAEHLDT